MWQLSVSLTHLNRVQALFEHKTLWFLELELTGPTSFTAHLTLVALRLVRKHNSASIAGHSLSWICEVAELCDSHDFYCGLYQAFLRASSSCWICTCSSAFLLLWCGNSESRPLNEVLEPSLKFPWFCPLIKLPYRLYQSKSVSIHRQKSRFSLRVSFTHEIVSYYLITP